MKQGSMRNLSDIPRHVNNMRWGLGFFLFLLIYDGALRKWVLSGAEQIVFIAKDALIVALMIYLLIGTRRINAQMHPLARVLFLLYAAWVMLQAVNLKLPNVLVGIWGAKAHLLYAGLIILLPFAYRNLTDLLTTFEKYYIWVVAPVCALAFVQLVSPPDSWVNQSLKGGIEGIVYFGEENLIRVAGTFSYITGMSWFVIVAFLTGLALFLKGARSKLFLFGLGFSFAALPITGSRGVIVTTVASSAIMIFAAFAAMLISGQLLLRIMIGLVVLVVLSFHTQEAAWEALILRAEQSSSDEVRVFTTFTNAFVYFDVAGFTGFGAGAANLGSPALVKDTPPFSWLPVGNQFEEESGRIVLELGIIGWLISLTMRIAMFFWALNLVINGRTKHVRSAAVFALPVMALGLYQGNGVFAPPIGAAYYWFCVALLAMAQFEHRMAKLFSTQSWAQHVRA